MTDTKTPPAAKTAGPPAEMEARVPADTIVETLRTGSLVDLKKAAGRQTRFKAAGVIEASAPGRLGYVVVEVLNARDARKAGAGIEPDSIRIVENARSRNDDSALVTMRYETLKRIVSGAVSAEPSLAALFAPREGLPAADEIGYSPRRRGGLPDVQV